MGFIRSDSLGQGVGWIDMYRIFLYTYLSSEDSLAGTLPEPGTQLSPVQPASHTHGGDQLPRAPVLRHGFVNLPCAHRSKMLRIRLLLCLLGGACILRFLGLGI